MLSRLTLAAILALASGPIGNSPYFDPALLKPKSCGMGKEPQSALSGFEATWYAKALSAAQEPKLYAVSRSKRSRTVYRFTWLGSFAKPVTVRVEYESGNRLHIIAKELSGSGGYDPGRVAKKMDMILSDSEALEFRKAMKTAAIFVAPSSGCQETGNDGGQWIFEAIENGSYHFAQAWSPTGGSAHDLGLAFLRLTKWGINPY